MEMPVVLVAGDHKVVALEVQEQRVRVTQAAERGTRQGQEVAAKVRLLLLVPEFLHTAVVLLEYQAALVRNLVLLDLPFIMLAAAVAVKEIRITCLKA